MIAKTDYYLVSLVGFLSGVFAIPTLFNLGLKKPLILLLLPLVAPLLFIFGLWLSVFLSRWFSLLAQFGRFVIIGVLNTVIDFGILNLISAATGITAGFVIGGVNIPGLAVAITNSYLWNKLWVFKDRGQDKLFSDFPKFLVVTIIGLIINSSIVILGTTYLTPLISVNKTVWLNMVKVSATLILLFWNFAGYKFLVFRQKDQ